MSGPTLFEQLLTRQHPPAPPSMTHYWRLRATLPDRHMEPCRLIACGKMNSIQIEFADGTRHIANRYAIRKLRP